MSDFEVVQWIAMVHIRECGETRLSVHPSDIPGLIARLEAFVPERVREKAIAKMFNDPQMAPLPKRPAKRKRKAVR